MADAEAPSNFWLAQTRNYVGAIHFSHKCCVIHLRQECKAAQILHPGTMFPAKEHIRRRDRTNQTKLAMRSQKRRGYYGRYYAVRTFIRIDNTKSRNCDPLFSLRLANGFTSRL